MKRQEQKYVVYYTTVDEKSGKRDKKDISRTVVTATSLSNAKKLGRAKLKNSWMASVLKPKLIDVALYKEA